MQKAGKQLSYKAAIRASPDSKFGLLKRQVPKEKAALNTMAGQKVT